MRGRRGRVAEGAGDNIGGHVKKPQDESRKNCKDSPNAEGIGDGSNPRIRVIVPEIINVPSPEIGHHEMNGKK